MKYAYSAVEAAALWVGADPAAIRGRMEATDLARLESDHAEAVACAARRDADESAAHLSRWNYCDFQCHKEPMCPDWQQVQTEDDIRLVLNCPQGFRVKPADEAVRPTVVVKPKLSARALPVPGEFADLPRFEERIAWLNQAISTGDLPGTAEAVLARDLREWMQSNFPGDAPGFLWRATEDRPATSSPYDDEELSSITALDIARPKRGPKRTKQFAIILEVVKELQYKPLRIPLSGKGEIHRRCVAKDAHLFTPVQETFNGIWQEAVDDGHVRVEGHERYGAGSGEKKSPPP
ncbi:hypothetical protein [Roseateles aquatilis]|uniref:hypothetical protein n=1 Tax=Roseateles aquatilis TaxID=431061 RepID=UPI0011304126|nr:hypothetical protein [Roseateles aquatilis]